MHDKVFHRFRVTNHQNKGTFEDFKRCGSLDNHGKGLFVEKYSRVPAGFRCGLKQ